MLLQHDDSTINIVLILLFIITVYLMHNIESVQYNTFTNMLPGLRDKLDPKQLELPNLQSLVHRRILRDCVIRFLPARRYASAGNSDRNVSVRLSVCPSVTRRYCVKTKKASVMISLPSGSLMILVF